ncbi:hypothetical protein AWJ20_2875 [Sugiyamaella lignohabitans]|uniref:DUF952 domain-containing protein n=1 Tax=Sugiyamaella lignohabitans TaxID=796027 RepID=A0A167FFZ4_9ASCO|nr:uncharacterized protein AWJ20_2875 [Sugiyamaella lignohabitans]ANB15249.1 hypothetical protein AWJ20_2875 [Sugiyamaella lignohabitans]
MVLYKILNEAPAEAAKDGSVPASTVLPLTPLDAKDGFIHLSTGDQLEGTLNAFFSDSTSVVLLYIDAPNSKESPILEGKTGNRPDSIIKWDWVESRKTYFAHIYGNLTNGDITKVVSITKSGARWENLDL